MLLLQIGIDIGMGKEDGDNRVMAIDAGGVKVLWLKVNLCIDMIPFIVAGHPSVVLEPPVPCGWRRY